MYNLLSLFCFVVNFPAVPVFAKKIRISRAGKNFFNQKKTAFFFSREKRSGPEPILMVRLQFITL